MNFASDNTGPAHPRVIEALVRANEGYVMPYGAEAAMERVRQRIRDAFAAPQAAVYLVATGTAANALHPRHAFPPVADDLLLGGRAHPGGRVQRPGVLLRRRQADARG